MARLRCSVEVPGVEAERLIATAPILIGRCRGVGFGADGCAVVDDHAHPEVRLVAGVAGQEGAAYELAGYVKGGVNAPLIAELQNPVPITMTVTTDRTDRLRAGFAGIDPGGAPGGVPGDGWVELDHPDAPQSVSFGVMVEMPPGTPEVFGPTIEVQGRARLSDLWQPAGPQIEFSASSTLLTAEGTALVRQTTQNSWHVEVEMGMHPSGYLVIANLAWPFLRHRAEQSLAGWIRDTMAETAARLQNEFGPADGPHEIAERVWATMTEPVRVVPEDVVRDVPDDVAPGDVVPENSGPDDVVPEDEAGTREDGS